LTAFWQSSTDVASAASAIVKLLGFGSSDEAYTLGIFHNCGIPLMMDKYKHYDNTLQSAYLTDSVQLTDLENIEFGTNHSVIGYLVSRSWKLPKHMRHIIRDHHKISNPNFCFDQQTAESNTMMAILKMAEHTAGLYATLGQNHEDNEWIQIKDKLLDFIGLSDLDFVDIQDHITDMLNRKTT